MRRPSVAQSGSTPDQEIPKLRIAKAAVGNFFVIELTPLSRTAINYHGCKVTVARIVTNNQYLLNILAHCSQTI